MSNDDSDEIDIIGPRRRFFTRLHTAIIFGFALLALLAIEAVAIYREYLIWSR